MSEMNQKTEISTIDFYGNSISLINKDGVEYVAMKPIIEDIGLAWGSQQQKLSTQKKFSCIGINTTGTDGKEYNMLCIPLKKLNGYLFSINPEKVKFEIKDKVIIYQEECFTVLHDYFNYGYSLNTPLLLK